jgi:hypothetical protein
MSIRRMGAVLALSTMAIVGTATAAAARDYPPTTGSVSTEAANVNATSSTAASAAADTGASSSSGSLPFTGGNDLQLVWIGAACAGAGALAVVKTRRNHRRA